jgi:hypothetical protein
MLFINFLTTYIKIPRRASIIENISWNTVHGYQINHSEQSFQKKKNTVKLKCLLPH